MSNPWTKKNPLMSMWLSGANAVWGAARGHAVGQAHRQFHTMANEAANQMFRLWTGAPVARPSRKKRKRR